LWFASSCRSPGSLWQSLASVDILVSVGPTDSIAAFESEKITALSNLSWCKFSRKKFKDAEWFYTESNRNKDKT